MCMENTELLFLRLTLANAYDEGAMELMQQASAEIDRMATACVNKSLEKQEDAV